MKMQTRIKSLQDLFDARYFKYAVVVPEHGAFNKPRPAAFMMNLSGEILLRLFNLGMYLYEKPVMKKGKVENGDV